MAGTMPTSGCSRCAMRSIVSPSGISSYDHHRCCSHSCAPARSSRSRSLSPSSAACGGPGAACTDRSRPALGGARRRPRRQGRGGQDPGRGRLRVRRGRRRADRARAALRRAQASDRPAARRHAVAELAVRRPARVDRPQRGLADPDQRRRRQGHRPHDPRRHPRLHARGVGQRRAAGAATAGEVPARAQVAVGLQGRRDRVPPRVGGGRSRDAHDRRPAGAHVGHPDEGDRHRRPPRRRDAQGVVVAVAGPRRARSSGTATWTARSSTSCRDSSC